MPSSNTQSNTVELIKKTNEQEQKLEHLQEEIETNKDTLAVHEGLVTQNINDIEENKARLDVHEGLVTQNISDIASLNVVSTGKNLEKMIGFYKNDPNQPSIPGLEPSAITGVFSNATLTTGILDASFSQLLLPLQSPQGFNVIGHNYIKISRVYDSPQYINPATLTGKHTMQVSEYYFNDSFTRMTVLIEYFGVDPNYEEQQSPGITQQLLSLGYVITPPSGPSFPIEYSLKVRPLYRIKMDDSEVPDDMKVY